MAIINLPVGGKWVWYANSMWQYVTRLGKEAYEAGIYLKQPIGTYKTLDEAIKALEKYKGGKRMGKHHSKEERMKVVEKVKRAENKGLRFWLLNQPKDASKSKLNRIKWAAIKQAREEIALKYGITYGTLENWITEAKKEDTLKKSYIFSTSKVNPHKVNIKEKKRGNGLAYKGPLDMNDPYHTYLKDTVKKAIETDGEFVTIIKHCDMPFLCEECNEKEKRLQYYKEKDKRNRKKIWDFKQSQKITSSAIEILQEGNKKLTVALAGRRDLLDTYRKEEAQLRAENDRLIRGIKYHKSLLRAEKLKKRWWHGLFDTIFKHPNRRGEMEGVALEPSDNGNIKPPDEIYTLDNLRTQLMAMANGHGVDDQVTIMNACYLISTIYARDKYVVFYLDILRRIIENSKNLAGITRAMELFDEITSGDLMSKNEKKEQ
jgi:hypothetical protein